MGNPTRSRWNSNLNIVKKQMLQINQEMTDRVIEAMLVAAEDVATQILEKADENVPEDEGDLRDSGRVERARQIDKNTVEVEVVYGNERVNYAFFVEMNMPNPPEIKNYTRSGSGPFYLTRAGDEITGDPSIINKAFAKAMREMNGR